MELERQQYQQTAKLIQKMRPITILSFGIVTAFNSDNRMVKIIIEPKGVETGWCKCLQGAYIDKIGIEVLVGRVVGDKQYIILDVIE